MGSGVSGIYLVRSGLLLKHDYGVDRYEVQSAELGQPHTAATWRAHIRCSMCKAEDGVTAAPDLGIASINLSFPSIWKCLILIKYERCFNSSSSLQLIVSHLLCMLLQSGCLHNVVALKREKCRPAEKEVQKHRDGACILEPETGHHHKLTTRS